MKKAIITLLLALPLACFGQSVTKTKMLKSTDLGNQKLEAVMGNDTTYAIMIKTSNRYQPYFPVDLGKKDNALRLLHYLYDLDIQKGDIVNLENSTNNRVTKNPLGGLRVVSETGVFSGQLRKPNIKGFIEAIEEFSND